MECRGSPGNAAHRVEHVSSGRELIGRVMSVRRVTTWTWLLLVLIVMWYPNTHLAGVNLASLWLQIAAFAIGAVLLAIADAGRSEAILIFGSQNRAPRPRNSILRGSTMLVAY